MKNWVTDYLKKGVEVASNIAPVKTTIDAHKKTAPQKVSTKAPDKTWTAPVKKMGEKKDVDLKGKFGNLHEMMDHYQSQRKRRFKAEQEWTAPVKKMGEKAVSVGKKVVEAEKAKKKVREQYNAQQIIQPQDLSAFSGFERTDVQTPKFKDTAVSTKKVYSENDLLDTLFSRKGVKDVDLKGMFGNLHEMMDHYQSQRNGRFEAEQELQTMTPQKKQDLIFETVNRVTTEKTKILAEQEAQQFENDVEEVIRKRLGVASYITNARTVKIIWDGMSEKDKKGVREEIQKKREKYEIMEKADIGFLDGLVEAFGREEVVKMEGAVKKSEAASKPWLSLGEGMLTGATIGISDIVKGQAEDIKQMFDPDTGGYTPSTRAMFEENKGLELATDIASGISYFVGMFGGGFLPYSAIAKQIQKEFAQIPGKAGKILRETPVLSTYVFRNIGEEVVEAGIRKATGQEYGFEDFMVGVVMGAGFEKIGRSVMLNRVEKALKNAETVKGGELTPQEFESVISPLPFNNKHSFGSAFGEQRLAFLKGKEQGTAGIDYPAPLPEVKKPVKEMTIEEAKKAKVPFDEWVKGQGGQSYRSTHQVDIKTASPITKIDDGTLNSFIDEFKRQYGYPALKSKEVNKLKTIISNPEADVKIYRASPKNELNDGDWVTIDKNYANDIKRQNGGKVYEYTVKAEDLFYPKTVEGFKELPSLNKWGAFQYQSSQTRSQLKAEWDKVDFTPDKGRAVGDVPKTKKKEKPTIYDKEAENIIKESKIKDIFEETEKRSKKEYEEYKKVEKEWVRLREIREEIVKREKVEAEIRTGTYAPAQKRAETEVRKSGGVVQAIYNSADFVLGKATKPIGMGIGKIISAVTPKKIKQMVNSLKQFEGLDHDIAKALDTWNKSVGREKTIVSEMVDALVGIKGSKTPEAKQMVKKFLLTGDSKDMPKDLYEVAKPVADEIAIEGLRQVIIGNLDMETYLKHMDKYVRRVYASHEIKGFEVEGDNYVVLKNTLEEAGWKPEKAEKLIVDLELGAVGAQDMQKLTRLSNKHDKITGGGVRAGDKGVTGGFLRERVLGDDKVSLAIREFLGEIHDPYFLAQKTMWSTKRSRLNHQLYQSLEKIGVIKSELKIGEAKKWEKIKGQTFGKSFEGKYIDKEVYSYIQRANTPVLVKGDSAWDKIVRFSQQATIFMKANVTSRNPAAQSRNFFNNFSLSRTILGHNYQSVSGVKDLISAARELRKGGEFLDELKAYGRLDGQFNKEIFGDMEMDFKKIHPNKIVEGFRAIDKKAGDLYQFNDMLYLMANYKKERAKGLSPLFALEKANSVTPNYSEISPLLKALRSAAFGLPFVTWRAKVYPAVVKSIVSTPVRGLQDLWFPAAWTYGVASQLNLSKEEEVMIATKFLRDGEIPLYRDEKGEIAMFHFSRFTPFDAFFGGEHRSKSIFTSWAPDPLVGLLQENMPGVGSLAVGLYLNLDNNYDPFLRRKITDADYGSPEWWLDVTAYMASSTVPFIGNVPKLGKRVASGQLDPFNAVGRGLLGTEIKKESVSGFAKSETYRDKDFSFDPREKEIKKEVKRIDDLWDSNPEQGQKEQEALKNKYPDKVDFIKKTGQSVQASKRTKIQAKIRAEVDNIANIAKHNKSLANSMADDLEKEYPEYVEYINKKIIEKKEQK